MAKLKYQDAINIVDETFHKYCEIAEETYSVEFVAGMTAMADAAKRRLMKEGFEEV